MKIYFKNRSSANALICSLYFWQYTLLLPFMIFMPPTLVVAVFSGFIFMISIFINFRGVKFCKKNFLLLIFVLLLFLFKYIEYPDSYEIILERLFSFITIGLVSLLIGNMPFQLEELESYFLKFSKICFGLIFWIPFFQNFYGRIGYMRFGYAMLPISCILLYQFINEKDGIQKYKYLFLYLISIAELFIWGARGSFVAHMLFVVLVVFFDKSLNAKWMRKIILLGSTVLIIFFESIVRFVWNLFRVLGISAYSVNKLVMQLYQGVEAASSGRDTIWSKALDVVNSHPFVGGRMDYIQIEMGYDYYHNILLEIGADFGLIVLAFFLVYVFFMFKNCIWKRTQREMILIVLFAVAFGRLFFSSTFWKRPEFWILLSIYHSKVLKAEKQEVVEEGK